MLFKHYNKGELELNFVHELLLSSDSQFIPALSTEINLYDYAEKLKNYANCLLLEYDNKVESFIFYYISDNEKLSFYITLICSMKQGNGQKIYQEFINLLNPKIVKLEVDKENIHAISFYNKLGFLIDGKNKNDGKLYFKHQVR